MSQYFSRNSIFFYFFLPILAFLVGFGINIYLVNGEYEWFGVARISYELFEQPGFWCIALVMWMAGFYNFGNDLEWKKLRIFNIFLICSLVAVVFILLYFQRSLVYPVYGLVDSLSLYFLVSFVLLVEWYRQRGGSKITELFDFFGYMVVIFFAYTAIAYFHTMIKGSLFVLNSVHDRKLWVIDNMFQENYYKVLNEWRINNVGKVRWLDKVYIGLLQQISWSIFYFYGSRDYINGRLYVYSMFLIYILGPIFYFVVPSKGPIFFEPELFSDLTFSAPHTWQLSRFLIWSTENTVAGNSHLISPFGYIAALPSLHVGIAFIMLRAMWQCKLVTIFNSLLLVLTMIATNVLGWHYVSDVIIGLLLGEGVWQLAKCISKKDKKVQMYDAYAKK